MKVEISTFKSRNYCNGVKVELSTFSNAMLKVGRWRYPYNLLHLFIPLLFGYHKNPFQIHLINAKNTLVLFFLIKIGSKEKGKKKIKTANKKTKALTLVFYIHPHSLLTPHAHR